VDLFNNGQRKSVSVEADTQEEAVSLAKANNPGWIKDPSRYAGTFLLRGAKDSSNRRSRLHAALDAVLDRAGAKDDWYGSSTEGERLIDAAVELRKKKPALVLKLRGKLSKEERAKAEAEYDALENAVRSKVREARNAGYKGPWT
jgi:hypothetical protein